MQRAYLLHQRPYRNSSAILEVYTEQSGRLGLVARGIRDKKGRGNCLQLFQPLLLSWHLKTDLGTLTSFESSGRPIPLSGRKIYSGFYLNELMMRLLQRQDANPELFNLYEQTLHRLVQEPEALVLRIFEKKLLELMGYGLMLDQSAFDGNAIAAHQHYFYHLERGPVPATSDDHCGIPISGKSLLAFANESECDADVLQELKRLMRGVLRFYLGNKPLKSRELFQAM